ncbi:MAG TPA: hypothetical protein PLF22_07825 [Pseudomonadales bacterium]|nr:hypothetical protein [Pseudomonadales bacterium]
MPTHVSSTKSFAAKSIGLLVISAAMAVPVMADATSTPGIDKREAVQSQRIEQGEASGQLTGKEATNLEKREVKLNTDEAAAKADGVVTKGERAHLQHEANRDSRKIARKKHNARKVPQ